MLRISIAAIAALMLAGCYESSEDRYQRYRQQIRADLDAHCAPRDTDCRLLRIGELRAANNARVASPAPAPAAAPSPERFTCQTTPGLAGWSQTNCASY